jgi:hypothetical protein
MSHHTDKAAGDCPLTTVLELATKTAKAELGKDASDKRVCTTATLKTAVTEKGKTKTTAVDAGVTLGVTMTSSDDAHDHCAHTEHKGCDCGDDCKCGKDCKCDCGCAH